MSLPNEGRAGRYFVQLRMGGLSTPMVNTVARVKSSSDTTLDQMVTLTGPSGTLPPTSRTTLLACDFFLYKKITAFLVELMLSNFRSEAHEHDYQKEFRMPWPTHRLQFFGRFVK